MASASSRRWSLPNTLVVCHTWAGPGVESFQKRRSIMGIVRMFDVQSVWFLAVVIRGPLWPSHGLRGRMWTEWAIVLAATTTTTRYADVIPITQRSREERTSWGCKLLIKTLVTNSKPDLPGPTPPPTRCVFLSRNKQLITGGPSLHN